MKGGSAIPFLYHPLVVHFPVALWLTSFLFDLLYVARKDAFFARTSSMLIGLGLLAAVVSVISGFIDFRPLVAQGIGQAFIDRHRVHSLLAYASTLLYLAILLIRRRPRSAAIYLTPAVVAAVLIAITGYLGGEIRRVM